MEHKCALEEQTTNEDEFKWFRKFTLLSADNPLRFNYFRSDVSFKEEQKRHLSINKYVIHPFSKFRAWYEIYLIFLYGSVLITKGIDAGFIKSEDCTNYPFYYFYNVFTDILCWIDIGLNFFTGYELKKVNMIELRVRQIAKHYMLGPYFFSDVISSIPKCLLYTIVVNRFGWSWRLATAGAAAVLGMFKAIRIVSFVKCTWRTADYFRLTSKGLLFLMCTMVGSLMIIHWLACLQFAIPRLVRLNFAAELQNTSWFYSPNIYNGTLYESQPLSIRYNHCLLKSSAYILGIRMRLYEIDLPEEYIVAIVTYFIGKVLIASIWIILAVAILNSRIMEIKFAEIINQLEEYMRQKQLPLNLQDRVIQHYLFKYRNKFFPEKLITSMLSETLRKEVTMYACKSLKENVSLFRGLNPMEISKVIDNLTSEIFLPNDTIIFAGTHGSAMYFINSGTVAVYSHSGKEICHLHDGAYFGEISLVLKGHLRSATIVALETSHIYRLQKKDLERHLLTNKEVRRKILQKAEERLTETTKMEEVYKEAMLEETLRKISTAP